MGLWPSLMGSLTGGTFALYSLLCRHAKLCLLPNHQAADEDLSTYFSPRYSNRNIPPSVFKRYVEKHKNTRTGLLLVVLFGASMVIAIGVITPSITGNWTVFDLFESKTWRVSFISSSHAHAEAYLIFCSFVIHWRAESSSQECRWQWVL